MGTDEGKTWQGDAAQGGDPHERLMGIIASATDAIITVDSQQRITLFNTAAERMFRCPAAQAMGQPLDRFIPQRFREAHHKHIEVFGKTGVSTRAMGPQRALAALRADGQEFPVEATISQIEVGGQKLYTAIVRDISERLRAEEALRESEERLRAIVETAVDAIITIDERGRIASFNPAATRIFGYQPSEVIGQNVNILMPAPYHQEHDTYLSNYVRTGIKKIIGIGREVTGRRKDGSVFPMDLAVSETRFGERRIFTGIVRDISERKHAEEALAHQADALARSNAELLKAKQAAEQASQAKDDFLAVVSHELRTPLNPVLAVVSALQDQPGLPEALRGDLGTLRRNIEMEVRLIDDLLDYTRIGRNKIELRREVVDLHAIIRAALQSFQTQIDEKDLEVSISLRAKRHQVWADASRLGQVFTNLFSNALKFTPEAGTISIRSENVEEMLRVTIRDTGVGIEPDVLPRLFRSFEQGERAVTRRFGGLGLGLSIVKALLDMHDARISASSEGRDKGATFTVEFQVASEERDAPDSAALSSAPPADKRRILLVEDHEDTRRIMQKLLGSVGYIVVGVSSVAEALAAADQETFDLLISDIGLPDGTGNDLMRQLNQRRRIPGIAVSGFGHEDDIARSRQAGFALHITKPIDFKSLQDAISRVQPTVA